MSLDGNAQSFIPYTLNGVSDAGLGTVYVPYTGAISDTDLGSKAIRTTNTPALANDLVNKTYVDTADALKVPYTGATGNVTLGAFNLTSTDVTTTGSTYLTGVATASPSFTLGVNGGGLIVRYANPVSSVFTGSVSSSYVPYATSANVLANSIISQSGTTVYVTGDVTCSFISPLSGYVVLDDRSLRPKDIFGGSDQLYFASWNNDNSSPFADAIGMNGWTDASGGNTNVLMVRKDTYGIRQYQGTFGSTTAFVNSPAGSAQYMDVCMKGVGNNTMTTFQPIGGSYNVPLVVGSGTDSGLAQLITTNGNIHIDPTITANSLYLGYFRSFASINKYTRYQYQWVNVDGDAHAYFQNASASSSAYFNLIIANNVGNVNHFINSSARSADGGTNTYTIRNDTNGGIRFMGANGGFSSFGVNSPGAPYVNAIANFTGSPLTGGGGWNNSGYTLICATTTPVNTTAALGLGINGASYTCISSIRPGFNWMDLHISAANTYVYVNGVLSAYSIAGGWVNVSDAREKEDINDLKTSRSLERIMKCKPKYYKRKYYDTDKDSKDATPAPQSIKDTICIGLLAQDVLQTNPHCVSGWKNDNIKETDDDDGSRYGINYGDFTVHLIGAVQEIVKQSTSHASLVQEQQKQIDAQAKQIADLTALVQQLASSRPA